MTPGLLILDLDGVLIDSEVISAAVLVELAAEVGVALDAAYVARHFLGRSFPTVARTMREELGADLPAGFEATYRARLLHRFEAELRPMPGAAAALGALRVPACVATSSSPERAARSLAIAGLGGLRVFTASEVARGKPAPDLFLHAAAAMGAPPGGCLVVEDSLPGLLAARAAGMEAVHFAGGGHLRGAAPFDMDPPLRAFRSWPEVVDALPALFRPRDPS